MRTVRNEDSQMIQSSVARFAEQSVVPGIEDLNHFPDHPLPDGLVEGLDSLGLFDLLLHTEMGGGGASIDTLNVVLETLAEKVAAPAGILFAHSFAQHAVIQSGNIRAANRLVRKKGKAAPVILAYPVFSEIDGAVMTAGRQGSDLVLNGKLEFVVNAPIASLLLVPVREGDSGQVSLYLLDLAADGIRVGETLLTLGLRGCPTADIEFRGLVIPPSSVVTSGDGLDLLKKTARSFRGPAAAMAAGVVACSIHRARTYAEERYQGGCNIIDYQQVRAMLADMLSDYATCCEAADRLSNGGQFTETESALMFIRAKEGAARATIDGVQLLGGYGYMEDYGQERCMRDAKQIQFLLGRCDPLRQELVGDWLGREGAL